MSLESNYMSENEKIHSKYYSSKIGYLHLNLETNYDFDKDDILKKLSSNIENYNDFINKFHIIDPNENGAKKLLELLKIDFLTFYITIL